MNILIVDDDVYVVEGIRESFDWNILGIKNVYTAYSMRQAQKVYEEHSVDILLCDIEMPKGNGLDLLAWVRNKGFETVCIFLTSHAVFDYANRAIRLECMDYVLKPIPYVDLGKILQKAVKKVHEQQQQKKRFLFAEYWNSSQSQLLEQFWLRVAEGIVSPDPKQIAREASLFHIDLPMGNCQYCLVLIQLKLIKEEAQDWEASLLEYALKNILAEVLFVEKQPPVICRLDENLYLAVISQGREEENQEEIAERCKTAISSCNSVLPCTITCYMSRFIPIEQVAEETRMLISEKENNILYDSTIFMYKGENKKITYYEFPQLSQWIAGIFSGEINTVYKDICKTLDMLAASKSIDRRLLRDLHHDFLQGIYSFLDNKGIQAHKLLQDKKYEYLSERSIRSIEDMKAWMLHTAEKALSLLAGVEQTVSAIKTVQQYVRENLGEELNRADIAANVFLSPDYLSHIFKDKTGMSLTEFIIAERLKEAKRLLRTTDLPIRDISLRIGYPNIAYFSMLFKRSTGKTPLEYRKQQD